MARSYARLADGARRTQEIPSRIVHAMQTRPFLVGGSDRFDSALIEATEGRVISKIGAEGVHSVALVDEGIGVALKVEDGAQRAQLPAVLAILRHLGALPSDLPPRLAEFSVRPVRNTRGGTAASRRARPYTATCTRSSGRTCASCTRRWTPRWSWRATERFSAAPDWISAGASCVSLPRAPARGRIGSSTRICTAR